MMLASVLPLAAAMLVLALLLVAWRLLRGPTLADRILALDAMSILALMLLVVHGLQRRNGVALEAALLIALLGFGTTVAMARFAKRGTLR